jgi:hypothetical protein
MQRSDILYTAIHDQISSAELWSLFGIGDKFYSGIFSEFLRLANFEFHLLQLKIL